MKPIKLTVLLAALALVLISAPLALAGDCNKLVVSLKPKASAEGWKILTDQITCDQGAVIESNSAMVVLHSKNSQGPKCHINFKNWNSNQTATALFTQTYCAESAGYITVTNEGDKQPCYQISKGDPLTKKSGKVSICTFINPQK